MEEHTDTQNHPANLLLASEGYRKNTRPETLARRTFLVQGGYLLPENQYEITIVKSQVPEAIATAAAKAGITITYAHLREDIRQFRDVFTYLNSDNSVIRRGIAATARGPLKYFVEEKLTTWAKVIKAYAKYEREVAVRAVQPEAVPTPSVVAHPEAVQIPVIGTAALELKDLVVIPAHADYADALSQATSGLVAQISALRAQASQGSSGEVLKHLQQERAEEVASFGRRLQTAREELTTESERADRLAGQLREYLQKEADYERALTNLERTQKELTERGLEIGSLRESLQLVREENNVLMSEWAQALEDLEAAKLAVAAAKTSLDTDIKRALEEIVAFCPDKAKARTLVTQLFEELAKAGDEQPATTMSGANGTYSKSNWPVNCTADGRAIKIPNPLRAEIGRLPKKHQLVIFRNLGTIVDRGFNFDGLNHVPLRTGGANQKCIRMGSFLLEFMVDSNALHFTKLWSNADFQKRR